MEGDYTRSRLRSACSNFFGSGLFSPAALRKVSSLLPFSSPSFSPPMNIVEKYTHGEVFSRAGFIDEISSFDGYRLGRLEVECARYNYGIMSVSV